MIQKTCLFFGKKNCKYSKQAISLLKKKKIKVTKILTNNLINEKINFKKFKKYDYIITYITKIILPHKLIKKAKIIAINFHNSLPKYPGSGGTALTILNNDKYAGITVHHLNKQVDNGKIIYVHKFDIKKNLSIDKLLKMSNDQKILLFKKFVNNSFNMEFIKKNEIKYKKFKWNKKVLKMSYINSLREIKSNMSKNKILKIITTFDYKDYLPYVKVKGIKFILDRKIS